MTFIITASLMFFSIVSSSSTFAAGAITKIGRWWVENPKFEYYYIEFEADRKSLLDFYALQYDYGWIQDLSGLSQDTKVRSRLYRDRQQAKQQWLPFTQNKTWFNKVTTNSPVTYEIKGSSKENAEFMQSMIRKGYKPGFLKVNTDAFTSVITFNR